MSGYAFSYVIKDLSKVLATGRPILKDIYLSFLPGSKIGVVGVNGSGKSTLLKIMAGLDSDFQGEAWAAQGISIGYLPQEPQLDPALDIQGNILSGLQATRQLLDRFNAINEQLIEPMSEEEMHNLLEEQASVQEKIDALNAWDLDRTIEIAIEALRCPSNDVNINSLSGGERRRVALCRLPIQKPDLLLLDEPTNHLDAESVAWLQCYLQEYKGTVVLVTHDRYFLDQVTGWILELDRGQAMPFEGNYSSWLTQKYENLAKEEKEETNRQKALQTELEWIKASLQARQKKSKARVKAYEALLNKEHQQSISTAQIIIPAGPRLGNNVIEGNNIYKYFGDRLIIKQLSFKIPPGAIVGIIGPNGAGKTTFCKILTGQEQLDSGSLVVGESVVMSYVDQNRDVLDDQKTVWQEIADGQEEIELGKAKVSSRAYCARFNFKGNDQQKKIGRLSGGERNRVHLAKVLKSGANVILLDEPTNDLDIETLRALEEGLENFAGCAIVVSHDRWFLDRVSTHILAFEGNSHIEWFEGNYQDYETARLRRLGKDNEKSNKLRHKPLFLN